MNFLAHECTRKKMLPVVLFLILLAGSLPGCQLLPGKGKDSATSQSLLVISGSTSMEEMNNALADSYMALHPDVKVSVQALGSSEGIQAAIEGIADIGASSRALKDEETALNPELQAITAAMDGIAIVVHPDNPISGLTTEEVMRIYSGEIRNWAEVGGNDHAITVIRREDGSGTLGAFCELVMGTKEKDTRFWRLAIIENSSGAILNAVANDPNGVGFLSMSVLDERIKAVEISGVKPLPENVLNGSYTLQRPYNFVVMGQPGDLAGDFIDYTLSDEGQAVVAEAHAIPIGK